MIRLLIAAILFAGNAAGQDNGDSPTGVADSFHFYEIGVGGKPTVMVFDDDHVVIDTGIYPMQNASPLVIRLDPISELESRIARLEAQVRQLEKMMDKPTPPAVTVFEIPPGSVFSVDTIAPDIVPEEDTMTVDIGKSAGYEKVICPVCDSLGLTSTLSPNVGFRTLMGFSPGHYDEKGQWVRGYDPNYTTQTYQCSNGHTVTRKEGDGWVGEWSVGK